MNAKLAALFETRLEDILRGRNKNASLTEVEKIGQQLEACNLPGREDLSDYVVLAKAMIMKDAGQALPCARNCLFRCLTRSWLICIFTRY